MSSALVDRILSAFTWSGSRSTPVELGAVEIATRTSVPLDLQDVLLNHGAGEGPVGARANLRFWPVADWVRINATLEVSTNWPGVLLFGEDGGGGFFGLDNGGATYVRVEGIGDRNREPLGVSLEEVLVHLASASG